MIALRNMALQDASMILQWRNNPEVAQYMYSTHVIEEAEHMAWMNHALRDESKKYWIIESDGDSYGLVNLYNMNQEHRRCFWAYYIGSKEARGKGIGTSVEFAIMEYVFDRLGFNKLCCEVLLSNEVVWELHQRFGFTREGLYREHIRRPEGFMDVVFLAILEKEWRLIEPGIRQKLSEKGLGLPHVDA